MKRVFLKQLFLCTLQYGNPNQPGSFIPKPIISRKRSKTPNSDRMFSRALSQSARMTSRAMRNSSIKSVVKRHSHDHAGTPQPPYVQRNAPTKSVSLYSLNTLTISFLSMLN